MSNLATTFSPGVLGGALRKGLQSPEVVGKGIQSLDGPSRAAIILMAIGPDVAGELIKSFCSAEPNIFGFTSSYTWHKFVC